MSDIVDRAKAALARRWERPYSDYPEPVVRGVVELGDWASEELLELIDEVELLRRGGRTLGDLLHRIQSDVLDATDSRDLIGDDGDGDWMAVYERLAELRPEMERLRHLNDNQAQTIALVAERMSEQRAEVERLQATLARHIYDGWEERTHRWHQLPPDDPAAALSLQEFLGHTDAEHSLWIREPLKVAVQRAEAARA